MLYAPPLAFLFFLLVAFLLGLWGRKVSPKRPPDEDAKTSYAGGEDIPGGRRFPGYKTFFPIALFFTVLHVLALFLSLLPTGAAWIGLIYAGIIFLAILSLVLR